jgi:hypothetical protein
MTFCGFQVAVHDPTSVRLGKSLGDLQRDIDHVESAAWGAAREPVRQRLTIDELHRDERRTRQGNGISVPHRVVGGLDLTDLVDGARIGVIQGRRHPRFPEEAGTILFVCSRLGREELQGNGPVERDILRPVDDTHASRGDQVDDAIAASF